MDNRPVSVVVPAYNAASTIDRCLDALARQTWPRDGYEIIVVDDGSTDDTPTLVLAHAGVTLLRQSHAGQATARNLGAAQARGALLLFTDADCAPAEDWIERMCAPFAEDEPEGHSIVGAKGVYLTAQTALMARFAHIEYEERYRLLAGMKTIDFVDTYSAAYRRDAFLAQGGFDARFLVDEDQELSFRLARLGRRLVFAPDARVTHWGYPESVGAYFRRKFRIASWKVRVLRQHPDKLWRDSHTPQTLKVQIALAALAGLCALGGLLWTPVAWVGVLAAGLFLGTTVPFLLRTWRRDRQVALASPFLLLVRALALGAGLLAGLVAK